MIGVHNNWPMAAYLETEALSASGIDHLLKSRWHYYKFALDPDRERRDTKCLSNGELLHTYLLEPERFEATYRKGPDCAKNLKIWKDAAAEAKTDGLELLAPSEYHWLARCRREVDAHPFARAALLSPGQSEKTVIWQDPLGFQCKARFDRVMTRCIIDLKSTRDASDNGFEREAARYRYDIKAAWYLEAARQFPELGQDHFGIVAIEIEYPSLVNVFVYEPQDLSKAELDIEKAKIRYAEGLQNGWSRDDAQVKALKLPRWLETQE